MQSLYQINKYETLEGFIVEISIVGKTKHLFVFKDNKEATNAYYKMKLKAYEGETLSEIIKA